MDAPGFPPELNTKHYIFTHPKEHARAQNCLYRLLSPLKSTGGPNIHDGNWAGGTDFCMCVPGLEMCLGGKEQVSKLLGGVCVHLNLHVIVIPLSNLGNPWLPATGPIETTSLQIPVL